MAPFCFRQVVAPIPYTRYVPLNADLRSLSMQPPDMDGITDTSKSASIYPADWGAIHGMAPHMAPSE